MWLGWRAHRSARIDATLMQACSHEHVVPHTRAREASWEPSKGAWGCSPFGAESVCFSNGYTCCPKGTTCQDKGGGYGVVTTCVSADVDDVTAHVYASRVAAAVPPLRVIGARGAEGDPVIGDEVSVRVFLNACCMASLQHSPH